MDEVQELLRYTFRTDNQWTIPVSGTGSASMEAAIGNPRRAGRHDVSPDERLLRRADEVDGRARGRRGCRGIGAVGEPSTRSMLSAFDEHQPDVFGFVHAETSTGVLQPNVPELTDIAHDHDALVIADSVTSLGGVELRVDEWDIDVAYPARRSASCPPGARPAHAQRPRDGQGARPRGSGPARGTSTSRFEGYWGDDRSYHHTAPISNVYALREALRLVAEEGDRSALGAIAPSPAI